MKKKKKRGGKKVNVEVKTESFFNIFNNLDPDAEDEKEKPYFSKQNYSASYIHSKQCYSAS